MKPRYFSIIGALAVLATSGPLLLPAAAQAPSTEVEATDNQNVEILTRGPVHEAFAEAVSFKPEPGFIVAKAPPTAIEELPPEQELEGENVTWISGYWAWDDDTNDFLWISGVWRNIPPGRQWVPGYWSDIGSSQWQWTSGYWADSTTTEVDYIEEAPPATVDAGPNIAAPSEDHTWIPGNWRYVETRYVWSPGYWTPLRPDWTWVPSRWTWSPRGYCYVDGYWDYAIARRGILFAPVHFHRPIWAVPGYYYRPSVVVSFNVFTDHFWVRPRFGHYYFGDYYAPRYSNLGFFASYAWHGRRGCYDPIWAHHRWHHRHDRGWDDRFRDRFDFFRNNEDARPFRTWAAMRDFRGDRFSNDERGRSRLFASTLNGFARNPVGGQRFRQLSQERRNQFVQQRQQVREFARDRRQLESVRVAGRGNADAQAGRRAVAREQLRRSPVVGRNPEQIARNQAPPRRPQAGTGRVRPEAVARNGQRARDIARNDGAVRRNGLAQRGANRAEQPRPQVRPNAGRNPERAQRQTPGRATPQATPQRRQQTAPQRQAAPQRQQARPQQRQAAPQRQQARPQQRQAAPQRQQARPQQRQAAPQRQQARPQQRQAAPQRQQARPQQRRAAPQRQQARPQQRRAAPQRQQARPQQRQAAPQRQQARPQQRQAAPQRQQARPQQRRAAPQRQQARPQQRATPQRQQPQQRKRKDRADA
jgi:hypothetical protein